MNYELFMGEALAEARVALAQGGRPVAAVAVVHDAMVARAHDRVQDSNDPTAHAVVVALREAARKMGTARLAEATIFATQEPCPMCVGALLESDVEALVFAAPNRIDGAAGTVLQLAQHPGLSRRLRLVTGIRRDEAEELFAAEEEQSLSRAAVGSRVADADGSSGRSGSGAQGANLQVGQRA
jgi:tRNA(adenine34) deaminase